MDDSFDMSEFKKKFPFPAKLDIEDCKKRTKFFAKSRLKYYAYEEDSEFFDIVLDELINEYPLPAGSLSIMRWVTFRNIPLQTKVKKKIRPLVENTDVDIGFVQMFYNENVDIKGRDTIGWFLGLVKPYDAFHMSKEEKDQLSGNDHEFLLRNMHYIFDDSMILLEGKLDDSIIREMKGFEKYYNKNILGKVITGRPRSDPEYWLEPARAKLRGKPDITQDELAYEIGCDLKTFKINRKNGGFATFQAFKDSVLKP
jgi:hypothetical protein